MQVPTETYICFATEQLNSSKAAKKVGDQIPFPTIFSLKKLKKKEF